MLKHRDLLDRIEDLEALVEKDDEHLRRKYHRLMKQREGAVRSLLINWVLFFVINSGLVLLYFVIDDGIGLFWPGFVIFFWSVGLIGEMIFFQYRYNFNRNAYDQKIKKQLANEKNGL